jgi:hypothetical protein
MPSLVRLDDISFGIPEVDAAFRRLREAVENANNWEVRGEAQFEAGKDTGFALKVIPRKRDAVVWAVVTVEITAAPSSSKLGQGTAVIREQNDEDLTDGQPVKVWSNFSVPVPVDTRIAIGPKGVDYGLIGADCPLT